MSGMHGAPIAPFGIEENFDQLQRRLNESDARERGTGRRTWSSSVTVMVAGATLLDNGILGWRRLNDGRIELRGRLQLAAPLTNGAVVLRLPGICAPPGNGQAFRSWISAITPCSSEGANPGMVRVDIERNLVIQQFPDEDGVLVDKQVIYADVIARPPVNQPLTGWIAFDHFCYDPGLYIDALEPVPSGVHGEVYSRGFEIQPEVWVVSNLPEERVPGEFGIAFLGYKNNTPITIVPGVRANG